MELRNYLTIKHHIPGRIRIQFSPGLLGDRRAGKLREKAGEELPSCIRSSKLNMFTRNVIIEYDAETIVPEKLHEALITKDPERFEKLAAELQAIMER